MPGLVEEVAVDEQQMLALMRDLDEGTNLFGPLRQDIRARLFAVADNPTQDTWTDAYSVIVTSQGMTTLWQAVLAHTDYSVRSKPLDGHWPAVPTRDQLLTALSAATRPHT